MMGAVPEPALLLVDDRSENLLALEAVLEPLGLPMERAESGEEALRRLLAHDFAVIVLDVQMPGMDGFETAEQIKQRERTRDVPIIFLTALNRDEEHRMRGFAAGAVDYIFKPVEPDLLRAKVSVFVELFQKTRLLEEQRAELASELLERKRAEERLARKSAELERSNADLEQFAYIASHDLQEPLRVIAGYLELIGDRLEGSDPQMRQWIERATGMAERMSTLLADVLTFARAGAGTREQVPVDLDDAFAIAVENLGAAVRDQRATVGTDGTLGQAMGEPGEVVQILQNLVGNAMRYRGEADPIVRVSVDDLSDDMVQVSVCDNGRGVAEEHLERVFGMFERVEGDPYPGTGLGLAVCRRLVERNGGRIWMERNRGEGVTVRFTLRAVPASRLAGAR